MPAGWAEILLDLDLDAHEILDTGVHGAGGSSLATAADIVAAFTETSGPTALTVGAIADGEYLKRVGATLVSGVPAGGGGGVSDAAFSF